MRLGVGLESRARHGSPRHRTDGGDRNPNPLRGSVCPLRKILRAQNPGQRLAVEPFPLAAGGFPPTGPPSPPNRGRGGDPRGPSPSLVADPRGSPPPPPRPSPTP